MSGLMQSVADLRNHLALKCGEDLKINLARHPAFGNTDVCMLIYGVGAVLAVEILKHGLDNWKVEEQQGGGFRGSKTYTYYAFSFTAGAPSAPIA